MNMRTAHLARRAMSPEGAQQVLARNLDLLRAIENTLDRLSTDTEMFEAICSAYEEIYDSVPGFPERIDNDDDFMQTQLAQSAQICAAMYDVAKKRHASACSDQRLRDDDGVADAYEEYMDAIAETHDAAERLREEIATHDAVLEPSNGNAYTDVDELIVALMS